MNRDPSQTLSGAGNRNRIANMLAMIGVFLFAFAASPFPHLAELALVLILIGVIITPNRHLRWKDPLVISMIVLLVYLGVSVFIGWRLFPDRLYHHISDALYILLVPFMVLLVAWSLRGDQQRMYLVLKAALGGLIFAIAVPLLVGSVPFDDFLQGHRHGMMFSNERRLGLYSAAALLGLLIFRPRWPDRQPAQIAWFLVYLFIVAFMVQALIVSHSRSAWLFGAIMFTLIALVLFIRSMRAPYHGHRIGGGLLALVLVVSPVAGLFYLNAPLFQERWAFVTATIEAARDGEPVGTDPVGKRYRMWELGVEKVAERPWLGHGPGSAREYLKQGHRSIQGFSHLHNLYIHLTVTVGSIGLFLVIGVFALLFVGIGWSWIRGFMDERMALFLFGALALFLLDNLTGYTISRGQGRFFIALIGGMAYSIWFWRASGRQPGSARSREEGV